MAKIHKGYTATIGHTGADHPISAWIDMAAQPALTDGLYSLSLTENGNDENAIHISVSLPVLRNLGETLFSLASMIDKELRQR